MTMPPQIQMCLTHASEGETQLIRNHYRSLTLEGFRTVPQEKSVVGSSWATHSESSVDSDETKVAYGEGECYMIVEVLTFTNHY
jgi:hypothetical protein